MFKIKWGNLTEEEYNSSMTCDLEQEDFSKMFIYLYEKTAVPRGEANFDPRDIIWAILEEVN